MSNPRELLLNLANVASRSVDEIVTPEELHYIQLELENLLTTSLLRTKYLAASDATASSTADTVKPKSPAKRKGVEGSPITKKPKEQKLPPTEPPTPASTSKTAKLKSHPVTSPISDAEVENEDLLLPQLDLVRQPNPKQDFPNKFWASIEPYCAPITEDDLKTLDDILAMHKDDEELSASLPPLGRHYSIRWAEEDLQHEQKESAHLGKKGEGDVCIGSEAEKMLKKTKEEEVPAATFGPLTQRLVGALLEENIVTSVEGGIPLETASEGAVPLTPQQAVSFERNIRKELEELGILNADEPDEVQADDQIALEIRRCQGELRALSAHNVQQLRKLQRLGRNQMQMQLLKDKLKEVDNEVLEHHRRFFALRQKKKEPSKKDKEMALLAMKAREEILKQIDRFDHKLNRFVSSSEAMYGQGDIIDQPFKGFNHHPIFFLLVLD
ncbi:transcriptional adapter 3-like isoform X2 [Artemia franciscana]|uniref:transcriptional adapter 3-like isoform X2 n=2 Tax=Artemia franciscana TaxID=6661 RepID=UPI0032DA1E17